MSKDKPALIVRNKTATRNYKLGESFQAGIVLEGWEVKSLRNGKVDIKDSYVTFKNNEAWLIGTKLTHQLHLKILMQIQLEQESFCCIKSKISKLQNLKGKRINSCSNINILERKSHQMRYCYW